MRCAHCATGRLVRAHRRASVEHVLACFGIYPYICTTCKSRCLRPRFEQALLVACILALGIGGLGCAVYAFRMRRPRPSAVVPASISVRLPGMAPAGVLAPAAVGFASDIVGILRNEDIVELSRSGLGGDVIAKLIAKAPHQFDVDVRAITRLKRAGVNDQLIGMIIDVSLAPPPGGAERPAPANQSLPRENPTPRLAGPARSESVPVAPAVAVPASPLSQLKLSNPMGKLERSSQE